MIYISQQGSPIFSPRGVRSRRDDQLHNVNR